MRVRAGERPPRGRGAVQARVPQARDQDRLQRAEATFEPLPVDVNEAELSDDDTGASGDSDQVFSSAAELFRLRK